MNTSLKIISFCIALCSIAGGASHASTFGSNYNSQEHINYDDPELDVKDISLNSLDIDISESALNAELTDVQIDDPSIDLVETSIADPSGEQLEFVAEEVQAPLQYVSQSKGKAPIYEIAVGDL
jgi:hypothetical protein